MGDSSNPKLPITFDLLRGIFKHLDLRSPFDRTFWAACLVGFFSFFRKSNLLVTSLASFDSSRHLCARDAEFTVQGVILTVRWSKVIQFRQRILQIPIPLIPGSPFCPSTLLAQLVLDYPLGPQPFPLFRYKKENKVVPLTAREFTRKLHATLHSCGVPHERYSGHSFRRGGATYALQCGLPVDLIKIQGDWNSNAYERYLEPSLQLRQLVAVTLGAAIKENIS